MALKANATLVFRRYAVTDDGLLLTFDCADPGPGEDSEYSVLVTDAELATVSTAIQFRNLVITKLSRRIRAAGIASKLDPLIGQSVTV